MKYCVDCGTSCKDVPICDECNDKRSVRQSSTDELRALHRDVFMAAINGMSTLACEVDSTVQLLVHDSALLADEAVRQWPAICAERDAAIKEVLNG